ncbi:Mco32p SCDLUD_000826 [Saccharomycodes ludwigii]|uniref:Mco32p n=1 Tax=Saccharomycodes ludwigii TaxID=36035 RepID=UPI001E8609F3|nr:hypothetical protein SCDLUD_000826 [Saccharomycodes ludwigii]KAH3903207.1 hypothetical protein SCDLUD_000826 [Saccharomycodes ludwigii]
MHRALSLSSLHLRSLVNTPVISVLRGIHSNPNTFADVNPNKKSQSKLVNMGEMILYLERHGVPEMLNKTISSDKLSDNIILRVLPTTHPYLPVLRGKNSYKATMNTISLIVRNYLLLKTNKNNKNNNNNSRNNTKIGNVIIHDANVQYKLQISKIEPILSDDYKNKCHMYNFYLSEISDKIVVKWFVVSIVDENSNDTDIGMDNITDSSNLGSHLANTSVDKINDIKHHIRNDANKINTIFGGIFIFELDENNEKILVHTIDSVEMLDNTSKKLQDRGKLIFS